MGEPLLGVGYTARFHEESQVAEEERIHWAGEECMRSSSAEEAHMRWRQQMTGEARVGEEQTGETSS
jgi:ribosomal protein L4